jgi:hypothetical protein
MDFNKVEQKLIETDTEFRLRIRKLALEELKNRNTPVDKSAVQAGMEMSEQCSYLGKLDSKHSSPED